MKLKRLLALLGSLVVATSASASLVACGTVHHDQQHQNELQKPELASVVTTTDLGAFDHEDVTSAEILTRVKEKNDDLDLHQVILSSKSMKVNETYRIHLSVAPTATSYRQSDVTLSYTIQLPDLRIELKQTIKDHADVGNFASVPTKEEILERVKKLNANLTEAEVQELEVLIDEANQTFEIKVKADSKIYLPGSIQGKFMVGQTKLLTEMMGQKGQILMLAEQFGLSQETLAKLFGFDSKTFNEHFDNASLDALTVDAKFHQPLGESGALISHFIGNSFKVANPILQMVLNSALGTHLTGDDYSAAEIGKAISLLAENILPLLAGNNFAQVLRQVSTLTDKIKLSEDQVKTLQTQVGNFVHGNVNQKYVLPIAEGIQAGTDLSRLKGFSFNDLLGALANNIVNALGYATQESYEPIDDVAKGANVNEAAKRLSEMILNGDFKKFNLNLHMKEFITSAINSLGILNHILSIVRTPNVEYTKDKDYSKNIFSPGKTNNQFISEIYKTKLSDIQDLDLTTFNLTELLSNLGYYLGGDDVTSQYRLQKVIYVLLIGPTEEG
jgi:hypothetical protein